MILRSARTIGLSLAGPMLGAAFVFLLFLALISPAAASETAIPPACQPIVAGG